MSYTITITVNNKNIKRLSKFPRRITRRVITLSKNELIRNLKKATPRDTGRARGSWHADRSSHDHVKVSSSVHYMKYLDKGTGIYGPKHRPITIKGNPWLYWKGAKYPVKQVTVKGIKPYNIVVNSIKATESRIIEFGNMAISEVK
ncbi:HK97 gp10 family phage protein [Methanobrevibacter filiformis]|uniref:Uncharacterized protein n=1 Tax=Methanobrevibacter filiformis TaxID=55758 RepID=A0A166FAG5_9EURY|nr:HK97 gp10 family phage protein [Methanobrevibacter filiformis]KZX17468.1 hypothetical protein MBFIL_01260 [Methanobrevibacter filiformis]